MPNIHLQFNQGGQSREVLLVEHNKPAPGSVVVGGRRYVLKGSESNILWLKEHIPQLSSGENISRKALKNRLTALGAEKITLATTQKAHLVAMPLFGAGKKSLAELQAKRAKLEESIQHQKATLEQIAQRKRGKSAYKQRKSLSEHIRLQEKELTKVKSAEKEAQLKESPEYQAYQKAKEKRENLQVELRREQANLKIMQHKQAHVKSAGKRATLSRQIQTAQAKLSALEKSVILAKKSEIDAYFNRMVVENHFRGAVLIKKNGKEFFRKAYGPKNADEPNQVDTRFTIASMTKMFTASAIMRLVQEGKLSLDDEINDCLPEEYQHPLLKGITVRHLLTHSSGLPSYGPLMPEDNLRKRPFTAEEIYQITLIELFDPDHNLNKEVISHWPKGKEQPPHPERFKGITKRDLLSYEAGNPAGNVEKHKRIGELRQFIFKNKICQGLLFTPGEKFQYSNSGYVLLGQIIKHISKAPSYEAYMKQQIFKPLHMTQTGFADSYDETNDAGGFSEDDTGQLAVAQNVPVHASKANAAGGIFSTLEDMSKWDAAFDDDSFLSPEMRQELFTPVRDPHYGLGFIVFDEARVGHDGENVGFNTFFVRNSKTHDSMVILGNFQGNFVYSTQLAIEVEENILLT